MKSARSLFLFFVQTAILWSKDQDRVDELFRRAKILKSRFGVRQRDADNDAARAPARRLNRSTYSLPVLCSK